jgi:AraC-like DNA-binding protein
MARKPTSFAPAIAALATQEGANPTRYPGALVWRLLKPERPTSTLYPACVIFVGSGEKRGVLGDEIIVYDPQHYLVVLSPMPMVCQTIASPVAPVLTFAVEIDLALLRELLADVEPHAYLEAKKPVRGAFRAPLTPALEATVSRFLACLASERASRALARPILREVLFHVLEGPYGNALRQLASSHGPTSQLSRVMNHIAEHYAERLPIEDLARLAHMSVPTFHQHFKAMTSTSPLQYVKGMRLTRARLLLQAGSSAKHAARDVGYESESQFSREFLRFFGVRPSEVHDELASSPGAGTHDSRRAPRGLGLRAQ